MAKITFFALGSGSSPVGDFVPYTGANQNVDLGAYGLQGDFVRFSLTPIQALQEGQLAWNDAEGTLDLRMGGNNVTQQIGEETYYYVKNQSGSTIANGTLVRASGTNGGSGHILVEPFLADGTYPSTYVIGITTEDIPNGEFGFVTAFGKVRGIQTNGANYGETWVDGEILYANSTISGGLTKTLPTSPNNKVEIAIVISASSNNGVLFVRPTFFPNLFQDEGTNISNPQPNEFLAYDDAQEVWVNRLLEVADLPTNIPATNIADGSVSDTEFQYLNGVTSNIQTQIDNFSSNTEIIVAKNTNTFTSVGTGSQTLASVMIPGGTISAGDIVQIRCRWRRDTNGTATQLHIHINTSNNLSGATVWKSAISSTTTRHLQFYGHGVVKNTTTDTELFATNTNVILDDTNNVSFNDRNVAIDWSVDQYILFSAFNITAPDVFLLTFFEILKR